MVLILINTTEVITITAGKSLTRLVSSIQNSVRKIPDLRCGIWNTHFISFIEIAEYFILHYFDSKWSFYKKKPLLKLNKPAKRNNKKFQKILTNAYSCKCFETLSLSIILFRKHLEKNKTAREKLTCIYYQQHFKSMTMARIIAYGLEIQPPENTGPNLKS